MFSSDYHLFGPMKEGLRGKHYSSDEKVKSFVKKCLKEQATEFYGAGIHALIRRWNIAIERNGDYVEKKGCDPQKTSFISIYDTCCCVGWKIALLFLVILLYIFNATFINMYDKDLNVRFFSEAWIKRFSKLRVIFSRQNSTILKNPPRQYLCYRLLEQMGNHMFIFASNYGIAKEKNMILPTLKAHFGVFKMEIKDNVIQYSKDRAICRNATRYNSRFPCKYTAEDKIFGNESVVYLLGYLQSWKYFIHAEKELRQLYTFHSRFIETAQAFLQETKAVHFLEKKATKTVTFVGIQVRRRFLLESTKGYTVATKSYFLKAMAAFKKKFRNIIFVLATDDREWCEKNLPDEIYMTEKGKSGALDMAILSQCNHTIASVGTFSWWSAWLTNGITTYYLPPAREGSRLRKVFSEDYSDFFWPGWIPIRDNDEEGDIKI